MADPPTRPAQGISASSQPWVLAPEQQTADPGPTAQGLAQTSINTVRVDKTTSVAVQSLWREDEGDRDSVAVVVLSKAFDADITDSQNR